MRIVGNTLGISPVKTENNARTIDTTQIVYLNQKEEVNPLSNSTSFNQHSFDVDFLTISLKFRPGQKGVPLQLNTNLNGADYVGFRTDSYTIRYLADPLEKWQRTITHYGFSLGLFTGIGNTANMPTTTNNTITAEYDGVVWTKDVAGIIAINNFTIGIATGFDNLLGTNSKTWIYQTKPWFGLAFGLNLN